MIRPPSPLRSFAGRLKGLFVFRSPRRTLPPRLRGKLRRAVVVQTPDPMFSEAVFILRDEALREPGVSREELLRQAARRPARHGAHEPAPAGRLPARRGGDARGAVGRGDAIIVS